MSALEDNSAFVEVFQQGFRLSRLRETSRFDATRNRDLYRVHPRDDLAIIVLDAEMKITMIEQEASRLNDTLTSRFGETPVELTATEQGEAEEDPVLWETYYNTGALGSHRLERYHGVFPPKEFRGTIKAVDVLKNSVELRAFWGDRPRVNYGSYVGRVIAEDGMTPLISVEPITKFRLSERSKVVAAASVFFSFRK